MDRPSCLHLNLFCLSVVFSAALYRDRDQRHARLAQFTAFIGSTPLEHLVRVHTMGSRYFGYAGARLQRQLYNLQLLGNRPPATGTGFFIGWLYSQNPEPYNSWGNGSSMRV